MRQTYLASPWRANPTAPSGTRPPFAAQVNEVLCKVLVYNLTVLLHAMYGLNVEPIFWTQKGAA